MNARAIVLIRGTIYLTVIKSPGALGSDSGMSERKVVNIRVAILAGIICILAIGLVADVPIHMQMTAKIADLQNQMSEFYDIVGFACSSDWITNQAISQPANSYSRWRNFTGYAGILHVSVLSSTTDKTYVQVIYETQGINYDQRIEVGSSGLASFPIMPTWIEVRVGNSDTINGATETVSIVFSY